MEGRLDVGNVFERIFTVYREQFTLLLPAALAVFVPVAILDGAIRAGGGVGLALIAAAISFVATFWYQGMVVEAANDIMDGRRDHTVGTLISSVTPVVAPLLVAGVLGGIGIAVGFILVIVPGLYLLTVWALLAPVIVIERARAMESFGRSRALVRGHGWQVFGVIVVLFLVKLVLSALVAVIFVSASDTIVGYGLADLITNVLIAPLSALAAAIMYFELKRLHGESVSTAPPAALPPEPAPGTEQP